MEHRALALEPGSLGGGAINDKVLVSTSVDVDHSSETFRLWDDPLLEDGCDKGSWGSSISSTVLDEGSSSM